LLKYQQEQKFKGDPMFIGKKLDEAYKELMDHQENVLHESIKSAIDGVAKGAKMSRDGKLVILTYKSGDPSDLAAKVKSALSGYKDKLKHIGSHEKDGGVVVEIEMK
jgi:hypothetical protein